MILCMIKLIPLNKQSILCSSQKIIDYLVYEKCLTNSIVKPTSYHWIKKKLSIEQFLTTKLNETLASLGLPIFTPSELDEFWTHYTNKLSEIHLFPKFTQLFDELSEFFKLGIITNGSVDRQMAKMTQLRLFNWVNRENVLISEEVGLEKPDPRIFTAMSRKLEVSPSEVAYVGNRYDLDVRGAKKKLVGMPFGSIIANLRNRTAISLQTKRFRRQRN